MGRPSQCSACGEDIVADSVRCPHCGERLDGRPGRGEGPDPALAAQVKSTATTSLILGVVAFVVCQVVGPFAIMKGNEAKREAARLRLPVPGEATAGIILGWVSSAFLVLAMGIFALALVFALLGADRAPRAGPRPVPPFNQPR